MTSYDDFNIKGIDVSHHQGNINYDQISTDEVGFVMIKLGGSDSTKHTNYIDECFERNYKGFTRIKVPVGVYWIVGNHFTTIGHAKNEAEYVMRALGSRKLQYPVALDIETTFKSDKVAVTRAAVAFCRTLLAYGFFPTIYASDSSGFNERLVMENLGDLHKWVAKYSSSNAKPKHVKDWKIWQYSDQGHPKGIDPEHRVDLDKCIYNYPAMIKTYGFNNYKGSRNQNEIIKSDVEVAREVIRGLWGSGNERTSLLTKAGRIPEMISDIVSKIQSGDIEFLDE